VDAAQAAAVVSVPDTGSDDRWPDWGARAHAAGVHSSLSIGLPVQEAVVGALNIYGTKPDSFDDDAIALAQAFAGYAAVAMANAHLYDTTASLAHHMQAAMESRAVIEQAKGIVMAERRCTAEEAFGVLVKISQDTNRKLRDVATALVDRATRPPER
jgi:GAF domain-containing protein